MKTSKLAVIISTLLLGGLTATSAQAVPVASAQSIVAFENFKIFKADGVTQLDAATDFTQLTVNSSQSTNAFIGAATDSDASADSQGATLVTQSTVGAITPASLATDFANNAVAPVDPHVVDLPIIGGNFAGTFSSEQGAPLANFFAAAPSASLYNASYASLDATTGKAGTTSDSKLTAEVTFTPTASGVLVFSFDVGAFVQSYLTAGADQKANAGFSVTFKLNPALGGAGLLDSSSNPFINAITKNYLYNDGVTDDAPGEGALINSAFNAVVLGDKTLTTTNQTFKTLALAAGTKYSLFAEITTSADVELKTVPEPQSLALLGIGLLGFAASSRKVRSQSMMA